VIRPIVIILRKNTYNFVLKICFDNPDFSTIRITSVLIDPDYRDTTVIIIAKRKQNSLRLYPPVSLYLLSIRETVDWFIPTRWAINV
jgi:hypothetical protein